MKIELIIFIGCCIFLIMSYIRPYIDMKRYGVRMTFSNYMKRMVKKSITKDKNNILLFELLELIDLYNLSITFKHIEEYIYAGGDLSLLIKCYNSALKKGIDMDFPTAKAIILARKDLLTIIERKKRGDKILITDLEI